MKTFLFASLLGFSTFLACGEEEKDTRTEPEGANPGECTDGADNDFDGDYDCNDSDCAGSPDCLESDCDDGADNDQDGDFDCDDSDCADAPECATEDDCTDGADNDADGLFDCDDPDCAEDAACVDDFEGDEAGECTDGLDNDSDGLVDCDDPDCANSPDCEVDPTNFEGDEPGECSDGVDNDQDGEYDCNDQDCEGSPDCDTQSVIGTENNAGLSCKEILDNGGSNGDGIYWIDPEATGAFEVYCDMTTDNGGWTRFYIGQNGSPNFFSSFNFSEFYCPDTNAQCLFRVPSLITESNFWYARCGSTAVEFSFNQASLSFFQLGTKEEWVSITQTKVLSGNLNSNTLTTALWTGSNTTGATGWMIAGGEPHTDATFANGSQNISWDYCNGVSDTISDIELYYR